MGCLRRISILGVLLLLPFGWWARAEDLTSFVVDEARIFSPGEIESLNGALVRLKANRQISLVILSIPTLGKESIEDVASRRFKQYRIGQRGVDNGLLFLIVKNDRKMRLEVGYGLEAGLPDILAKQILDGEIRPFFQQAKYADGCFYLIDRLSGAQVDIQRARLRTPIPVIVRFLPAGLSLFFFLFIYYLGYREDLVPEAESLNRIFGPDQWPEKARKYRDRVRILTVAKGILFWLYIGLSLIGSILAFMSQKDWVVALASVAAFVLGLVFIFLFRFIPFTCRWRTWYAQYPDPIKSKIRNHLKASGYRYSAKTDTFVSSSSSSSRSSDSSSSSSPSEGGSSGGGGANSSW